MTPCGCCCLFLGGWKNWTRLRVAITLDDTVNSDCPFDSYYFPKCLTSIYKRGTINFLFEENKYEKLK